MKKVISLLIVAMMLTSMLSMAFTSSAKAEYIDYVEAYYFETAPNIDGYITTAEWGEPTFSADSDDAVTKGDSDPYMNRYFYWKAGHELEHISYQGWLRWDENYYYVGIKVKDEDGHSLKNGKNEAWNGDGVQFRVDSAGPNAASFGETFDVSWSDDGRPWSSSSIGDFVFGYVQIAGGFCEAYENTSLTGMTAFSDPSRGVCLTGFVPVGSKNASGADYTPDSATYSTYEIALPWTYIDDKSGYEYSDTLTYNALKNKTIAVGREYGMSMAVLNAPKDEDLSDGVDGGASYTSFLTWGSGVCGVQNTEAPKTCGGSNSVKISKTKVACTPTTYAQGGYPTQEINKTYDTVKAYYQDSGITQMLTYDNEGDLDVFGRYGDSAVERIQLEDGNWVIKFDKDETEETGLNVQNYIETSYGVEHFNFPLSYTMDMKVNVTGTEIFEASYGSELYNWFGGAKTVDYQCGYFFDDGAFKIVDTQSKKVLASKKMDFAINTWHDWRFQYDNETCTARLFFDGQLIFNVKWRYFFYSASTETPMIVRRMNVQCMFDDIDIYNFVVDAPIPEPDPVVDPGSKPDEGTGGNQTPVEVVKKGDVANNITKTEDGKIVNSINYTSSYASAKKVTFTTAFDTDKLEFVEAKSIPALEGKYNIVNKNGECIIAVTDPSVLSSLAEGDSMFSLFFKPTAGNEGLSDADLNSLMGITVATVTQTSGGTTNNTPRPVEVTHEQAVSNEIVKTEDGKFENIIKFVPSYASAKKVTFTANFDASKLEFVEVTSAAALEGKYEVVNKEGQCIITITDMAALKDFKEGDMMFNLFFKPTAGNEGLTDEEIGSLMSISATTVTVTQSSGNTGDTISLIAAGMVVAIGVGYAVVKRKKYIDN